MFAVTWLYHNFSWLLLRTKRTFYLLVLKLCFLHVCMLLCILVFCSADYSGCDELCTGWCCLTAGSSVCQCWLQYCFKVFIGRHWWLQAAACIVVSHVVMFTTAMDAVYSIHSSGNQCYCYWKVHTRTRVPYLFHHLNENWSNQQLLSRKTNNFML